jgi:hypothetical protein
MDMKFRDDFSGLWRKYFNHAELPITFYYTDEEGHAGIPKPGSINRCIIGTLVNVREGTSYTFNVESVGCFGGKKYLGFSDRLVPNFEYFLSYGIPGKVEGERYKKSPELVTELLERWPVSSSLSVGISWKQRITRKWLSSLPNRTFYPAFIPWPIMMWPTPMEWWSPWDRAALP